jgi:CheY-like chemotaxis protein
MRVLFVIEPHENWGRVVRLQFRDTPYAVEIHSDALSARRLAKTTPPAAVLLTVDPTEPGWSEELARFVAGIGCPVVVAAFAHPDRVLALREQVLACGAADFVRKPFWRKEIVATVKGVLGDTSVTPPERGESLFVAWLLVSALLAIVLTIAVLTWWPGLSPDPAGMGTGSVMGVLWLSLFGLGLLVRALWSARSAGGPTDGESDLRTALSVLSFALIAAVAFWSVKDYITAVFVVAGWVRIGVTLQRWWRTRASSATGST